MIFHGKVGWVKVRRLGGAHAQYLFFATFLAWQIPTIPTGMTKRWVCNEHLGCW